MFGLLGPEIPPHVAHFDDAGDGKARNIENFFRTIPPVGTTIYVRLDSDVILSDGIGLKLTDHEDCAHTLLKFVVKDLRLTIRRFKCQDPKKLGQQLRDAELQIYDVTLQRLE